MTEQLSRRALLSAGGAAGATLALAGGARAQELAPGMAADVIEPVSPSLVNGAGRPEVLFFSMSRRRPLSGRRSIG